ncbi:MAG: ABC transporter ATP-binding protein [Gammaproteobacteria bacterium]
MGDEALIRLEDVHFGYGSHAVFSGLSMDIPKGKITAIMGPSGTGKTTLLELVTGQRHADRGEVRIHGRNLGTLSRKALFRLRREMGLLFQEGALFSDLSVFENVAFPLREHTRLSNILIHHLVLMKLEAVGLRGAALLNPSELSGGMARRVALARSIVLDPVMMFYDEPLVGLDPIAMGVILRLIVHLNKTLGMTSVIVTHDVKEVLKIADGSYIISEGRVVAQGSPSGLAQSRDPWVRQFLEGAPDGPVPFNYPARDFASDLFASGALP